MQFEIDARFKALERLILLTEDKNLDPEIAGQLAKLGSVQVCGNVERCIEILVTNRISARSPPQVGTFLKSYFKKGTNYDCEEIKQLLYRLDSDWGRRFEELLSARSRLKDSLSGCYAVRNSVAHGGSGSLGPRALRQYFDDSFDLIAGIEAILAS